jgi:putative ABC transport system ATP-binding protein
MTMTTSPIKKTAAEADMSLVELKNVKKTYRLGETTVNALRGIQLSIKKGEFTSIIGASGSGKSTLLNLIGCLDRPDSGSIVVDGHEVTQMSELEQCHLRNEKIGFIFQSFNLVPVLNVWENVELPLLVKNRLPPAEKKQRVDQVLEAVGLTEFQRHRPDQLSGGQRQRVAIARALVTYPSLVIADEPTANLDSKTAHMILDLMADLNRTRSVTFIFCSHDEKLISRTARVVRIQDGLILE